jgi:hypothetical protein
MMRDIANENAGIATGIGDKRSNVFDTACPIVSLMSRVKKELNIRPSCDM